ncbi:MAG: hypothetical protein ACM3SX_22235, partial [Deltaproteobacteria bacterium]
MNRSIPIVIVRALSLVVATGITAQIVFVHSGTGELSTRATYVRAAPADAYVHSTGVRPTPGPALGTRSAAGLGLHDSPALTRDQTKRAPEATLFALGAAPRVQPRRRPSSGWIWRVGMSRLRSLWRRTVAASLGALFMVSLSGSADEHAFLPSMLPFANPSGLAATFSTTGKVDLTGAFFQSLGTNGRACVTCHQPSTGWTITPEQVQARFDETAGTDAIFRTNDGS